MSNLWNLYAPKSIISSSKVKGCYVRYKPSTYLSKFIYCYWASPSDSNNIQIDLQTPKDEFIVPDGCLDIVFTINKKTKTCECTVYGTLDKPLLGNLAYDKIQTFGITFYPGGSYPFLKTPLVELKNRICLIDDILQGSWKKYCLEIGKANSILEMIEFSNKYYSSLLEKHFLSDSLCNILYSIYKSKGNITIKELSQSEIISERHIRRIFDNWVGINPKTFSRIVRFQNVIESTIHLTCVDWLNISLDYGYYDEAHFFNEFREFYGATPSEYLKSINIMSVFSKTI